MIIDFHTHIFPDKIAEKTISLLSKASNNLPHANGTLNGLKLSMDKAGVDLSVVLPVLTKPEQYQSVLDFAKTINDKYLNKEINVISFAGIHPKCQDIPFKMQEIASLGFKGVKIHPQYQNTYIDDEGYRCILSWAKRLDLIVVTHAGVDEGFLNQSVLCPPDRIANLIKKVNHNKFVLAHFGGNCQWKEAYEYLAGENVYFDTAFVLSTIPQGDFIKILNKHGADKILFASDSPWREVKNDIQILKNLVKNKKMQKQIFEDNAKKLLNISE